METRLGLSRRTVMKTSPAWALPALALAASAPAVAASGQPDVRMTGAVPSVLLAGAQLGDTVTISVTLVNSGDVDGGITVGNSGIGQELPGLVFVPGTVTLDGDPAADMVTAYMVAAHSDAVLTFRVRRSPNGNASLDITSRNGRGVEDVIHLE